MDKRTFGKNKETKIAGYKWPGAIGHNHEWINFKIKLLGMVNFDVSSEKSV
jgi:hypothetical protein